MVDLTKLPGWGRGFDPSSAEEADIYALDAISNPESAERMLDMLREKLQSSQSDRALCEYFINCIDNYFSHKTDYTEVGKTQRLFANAFNITPKRTGRKKDDPDREIQIAIYVHQTMEINECGEWEACKIMEEHAITCPDKSLRLHTIQKERIWNIYNKRKKDIQSTLENRKEMSKLIAEMNS